MTDRTDTACLQDMLDAATLAAARLSGRSRSDLDQDVDLRDATIRRIEVIGEAAGRVSSLTREAHPEIPWYQIVGTRHRLIHGYAQVDLDIVWDIVTVGLPPLIEQLKKILVD